MCTGGRVVAIYTAAEAGSPMQPRSEVRAVAGRGLEGDRYFAGNGMFASRTVPGREVTELTLIESEVIEHLRADWGLDVSEGDSRRNLVTRGVALNELVGVEFSVGAVRLRGAGLCEPCVSLVKSPENEHLLRALVHKGGLRAQIVSDGWIAVGDLIGAAWRDSTAEVALATP
jgi:MOSC domain-containing protein YiiM